MVAVCVASSAMAIGFLGYALDGFGWFCDIGHEVFVLVHLFWFKFSIGFKAPVFARAFTHGSPPAFQRRQVCLCGYRIPRDDFPTRRRFRPRF